MARDRLLKLLKFHFATLDHNYGALRAFLNLKGNHKHLDFYRTDVKSSALAKSETSGNVLKIKLIC